MKYLCIFLALLSPLVHTSAPSTEKPAATSPSADSPSITGPLTIVTEDWAPFQFEQGERVTGMATEVVEAVLREAQLQGNIAIYPWARAYNLALRDKNTAIYSLARTSEREHHFLWIGEVAPYKIHLWKLRKREDIVINTLEDAKKYKMGGVYKDVKTEYLIANHGFRTGKHIYIVHQDMLNLKMLLGGRIDYFPHSEVTMKAKLDQLGVSLSEVEKVYTFTEGPLSRDLYLALNIESDKALASKLTLALKSVRENGTYARIRQKYLQGD